MEMRYSLNMKPGDPLTEEMINKYNKENSISYNKFYDPQKLIELNKRLAYNKSN
jgi:hypothetical protein